LNLSYRFIVNIRTEAARIARIVDRMLELALLENRRERITLLGAALTGLDTETWKTESRTMPWAPPSRLAVPRLKDRVPRQRFWGPLSRLSVPKLEDRDLDKALAADIAGLGMGTRKTERRDLGSWPRDFGPPPGRKAVVPRLWVVVPGLDVVIPG
jgi:hypothetical protein